MWKCPKCNEEVEDNFEVCWNCGTTQDGVEEPAFRARLAETSSEAAPLDPAAYHDKEDARSAAPAVVEVNPLRERWFWVVLGTAALAVVGWLICGPLAEPLALFLGLVKEVPLADQNLDRVIRQALHKPVGRIMDRDLSRLQELDLTDLEVKDASFLEYCTSLRVLRLGEVSGDYPPLDGLTKLEELSLKTFDLKDSSFIEHCPNLRVLRLGQVRRSLPPLDTLTRLEILEVAGNWDNAEVLGSIKGCKSLRELRFWGWRCDLAPLSGLSNLRVLHVHVNGRSRAPIRQWLKPLGNLLNLEDLSVTRYGEDFDEPTDLGPLGSLSGLRYLALQQNQIHDLNPLTGLVNLKELQLGANSVSDLRPLSALGNLGLLFLEDNQIRDISPLASLTGLQWLSLGHNQIGDIRPLAKLEDLRILQVERNRIQDISPLVGLLQLGQYRPFDTDGRYLERMRVVRRESGSWSTAFGYGNGDDVVSVIGNPLNDDAYRLHIPALQQRGIRVRFNPKPSGQVIRFGDKNLERAVRDKLMIPNRPIYESDNVVTLSNLRATQAGISDLDGIEHCTNLRELDLQNNPIRDLRPLAELTKLESLRLGGNKIVDVSPLAELPNLTELFVNNNPIRDIRPLAKVSQLKALWLSSDGIQDISPLSRLSHLTSLNLSGNRIQDISPLAHLSHLSALDLRSNRIHDVSPLRRLTELGTPPTPWVGAAVDLRDNPLDQEAYAVHIPALLATLKAKGATLLFTPKP